MTDRIVIVVLACALGYAVVSAPGSAPKARLVGKPAPPFKLRTRAGKMDGPEKHPGKIVLLDFWATWCNPCFRQMPIVEDVAKKSGGDMVVLAVNIDDPSLKRNQAIDKFLHDAKVKTDALIDDGSVAGMYGVSTIPQLVLIDKKGTVRWATVGLHSADSIEAQVNALRGGGDG